MNSQSPKTVQLLPGTNKNIQENKTTLITVARTTAQYRTRSFLNEYLSHNTSQETEKKKVTPFRQQTTTE